MQFPKVLLASGSPRRKELLEKLHIEFDIFAPNIEEYIPDHISAQDAAEYLAIQKARSAYTQLNTEHIILASDSIVVQENTIFGKPKDSDEAFRFIRQLANNRHKVITGVCLKHHKKERHFSSTSTVFMEQITDEEISYYINHYEVMDKAGAYGIQDWLGMAKISRIDGLYTNIMGLPLAHVYKHLVEFVKES